MLRILTTTCFARALLPAADWDRQKAFDYLDAPPQTVTAPHTPVPFSPVLEDLYIPSPAKIAVAVRAVAG